MPWLETQQGRYELVFFLRDAMRRSMHRNILCCLRKAQISDMLHRLTRMETSEC